MTGRPRHDVVDLRHWWAQQAGHPAEVDVGTAPGVPVRLVEPPPADVDAGWGVRVALLCGVVDLGHPDLTDARIESWPGLRGLAVRPVDPRATAAATILVGQGHAHVRGLAPAARLLVAPVLGVATTCTDELVARALRWALAEVADVVVLPFGRRRLGRRVATTLRRVVDAGVTVLASAGDLGPGTLAFPASTSGVVAVTAHDGTGLVEGSSRVADLAAPGARVPAGGPEGAWEVGGAGVATTLAAGAWAARRSRHVLRDLGDVQVDREAREREGLVHV